MARTKPLVKALHFLEETFFEIVDKTLRLKDGAIGETQIANGSITAAKLSTAGASEDDVFKFDGAAWVLAPAGSGSGSPLVGTYEIDENTGVITIFGSNGGTISGSYEIDENAGTISIDFS